MRSRRLHAVVPGLCFALSALFSSDAHSQNQKTETPKVTGLHATISPYAGWTLWSDDANLFEKPIYGGRLGLMFGPMFGVEGTYGWSPAETKSGPTFHAPLGDPGAEVGADVHHFGLDLMFTLPTGNVAPYILAGYSQITYESDDPAEGSTDVTGPEAAVGIKFQASPRVAARVEARDVMFSFDSPPAQTDDLTNNLFFTVGVQFALGGKVVPDLSADIDVDGVPDVSDRCPGTPAGALVDVNGCPVDGDKDGVPDGIDQCANTPAGAQVDPRGCPSDADSDGVPDGIDQCANTAPGAAVDARGCPADSDMDGVPDGVDQCANTPTGATVDARGCPSDSDADGVVDGTDKCPNTPAGAKVDTDGCPIEVSEREVELLDKGVITVRNINFETAKWTILPESFSTLDEIGNILIQWPQLRIEIGGHADARGSESYNLDLSQKRAQAVLDYLVQKYPQINSAQYTAKGYGESVPVAPNNTVEGMARNRRVEFKVLNTEELKKEQERRRMLKKDE